MGIVDAQSVQNADTGEEKGYDAGKKYLDQTPRCRRYDGLPHAIAVTTADVTDRDGAVQMILFNLDNLSCVKKFLVDGGYSGERFANQVKEICGAQVEVVKRSQLHKFVVLPRRWVVERLFGWLDKFRRLWKIVNANSLFLLSFLLLPSLPFLLEDFKQALSVSGRGDGILAARAYRLSARYTGG